MHKSFKNAALAGAALALAMTPALAGAQDGTQPGEAPQDAPASMPGTDPMTTPPTTPTTPPPATTDSTTMDSTTTDAPTAESYQPDDKQAAMEAWPAETKTYFQSLTPERQQMFWALTDTDKVRLSQLPEEQREVAWGQIESQLAPSDG